MIFSYTPSIKSFAELFQKRHVLPFLFSVMKINDRADYYLHEIYGKNAVFREGQAEAVEASLTRKNTLVVQKTGWGKSLVYFICTKILRELEKGITVVVSPLLVLMENQYEAAVKCGLKCDILNSTTASRRNEIIERILNDELDLIFVTPESLFKDDIKSALKNVKTGLFVIDEAHCVSDWGHDFRHEYGNIHKFIKNLPSETHVLATTATANKRVIADLKRQLGNDVFVSKGSLYRESLAIQVVDITGKTERYAWILQNISEIPGSGIIYCLTQRDCDYLSDFLNRNGVHVMPYYSRSGEGELKNKEAENLFRENKIKAVVATVKLGMGYDKDDISFVIHYQCPSNVVAYYQQIGRAGRNIGRAYAFLLSGEEDKDIIDYFISTAFPAKDEMEEILNLFEMRDGLLKNQIYSYVNIRRSSVDKNLSFLENEGYLTVDDKKYFRAEKDFEYNKKHYDEITAARKKEIREMKKFMKTKTCYSRFIQKSLDDDISDFKGCGICSNCRNREIISSQPDSEYLEKAKRYIENLTLIIEPRRLWSDRRKIKHMNEAGICLSKYGDPGYGQLVKRDKYSPQNRFCEELVGKSRSVLASVIESNNIKYITCIPSIRNNLVEDFSRRLAESCGLSFIKILSKREAAKQKSMQNSEHQCENAVKSFYIEDGTMVPDKVILVDDIVDSGWTLTVCGYKIMEMGCERVIPFALADSGTRYGSSVDTI